MLQEHRSRPLWARELKPETRESSPRSPESRPLWARELKLVVFNQRHARNEVAPLVGA